jgi:protocatechuate 3,4-dioxygenase beta subunit
VLESVPESASVTLGPGSGIPSSSAEGERLIIRGTVYNQACIPVPAAELEVWQTDANGEYGPGHGTEDMQCCYLQGAVRTGANGEFQLITVMPGHYKGEQQPPPAHIHVAVHHPDFPGGGAEIVFTDDPYLPPNAAHLDYTIVSLAKASDQEGDYLVGVADIILKDR